MRKKFLIVVLLLSIAVGSFFGLEFFRFSKQSTQVPIPVSVQSAQNNIQSPPSSLSLIQPFITNPTKLVIPKLNVDTSIEAVGLDSKNNMDVPKGIMHVAWFKLGYKIGEAGNAVIAGHYDKKDGSPEIFYRLGNLEVGDQFSVVGADKKKLTFQVTSKKIFDDAAFPIEQVFGSFDKPRLNLITCSGVWDSKSQNYSKRTVVFSELVQ